jgi:hypothetical protein
MSSCWLCLGCSPQALENLSRVDGQYDISITCNKGIELLEPDYYFLWDTPSCELYAQRAKTLTGTTRITMAQEAGLLKRRNIHWFDELVCNFKRYEPFQFSGLWCLEYACRHFADTVLMVGMDGYQYAGEHFNCFIPERHRRYNKAGLLLESCTRTIVNKYPDVSFRLYGNPTYSLVAENFCVAKEGR